jgi:hypothetical protein
MSPDVHLFWNYLSMQDEDTDLLKACPLSERIGTNIRMNHPALKGTL